MCVCSPYNQTMTGNYVDKDIGNCFADKYKLPFTIVGSNEGLLFRL